MANWAESVCLKCGTLMDTSPCLVIDDEDSFVNDYPKKVRDTVNNLKTVNQLPIKHHISSCKTCKTEILVAVQDLYLETPNKDLVIFAGGEYRYLSDNVYKKNETIAQQRI